MLLKAEIDALFYYDDGRLMRRSLNRSCTSPEAGHLHVSGYLEVDIAKKRYKVHRLIYTMFHGTCPAYLDHIDRNRSNNRIDNLRPTTLTLNSYNKTKSKRNTSGYMGVFYNTPNRKWQAQISVENKHVHLGMFSTPEEAATARDRKAIELYGEFANLNFPEDAWLNS